MSGEELAAEAQISAAKRRAVEVRAEAAMLVEAVEDRAFSVSASPTAPPKSTEMCSLHGADLLHECLFHSSFVRELRCAHCISGACHAHGAHEDHAFLVVPSQKIVQLCRSMVASAWHSVNGLSGTLPCQ